jgi:hypothetical protein
MSTVAFVQKVNSKTGQGRKGPWTLWSMKLADKDGNELPGWYSNGFEQPPCKEGDYVKLEATPSTRREGNFDVVKGSIQVSKNPPARAKSAAPAASGGTQRATTKTSDLFGEIGGYNTEDDIRRMSYSAARSDAVRVAALLLENQALPLSAAKAKAGAAQRFDEITEIVDKLTVEFFYDAATGRKLETVVDAGDVAESEPDALPDTEEDEFDADGFDDDGFDGDDDGF